MNDHQTELLRAYRRERDALLQEILITLQHDGRITAAWLMGSMGRGEGDVLSDLDLWLVVGQESITQLINERRSFAAQAGDPTLYVEAPQNAPEGGGYLAVCYDAPTAPHLVDWYWQPESQAFLPVQAKLLFDRIGLARWGGEIQFSHQAAPDELISTPIHFISFFWMMLLITAKHVARQSARVGELLDITLSPFRQTLDFITSAETSAHFSLPDLPISGGFGSNLTYLRQLAVKMQAMMLEITEMGYPTPNKIVPGAFRFLDMVDDLLRAN